MRRIHAFGFLLSLAVALPCFAANIHWVHLSSINGDLPPPGTSPQQTGLLVARLDRDSSATDFVVSCRVRGPALVWYRHTASGWKRYVIEKQFLPLEAGGAAADIDGDGDTDIVFGEDRHGNKLWWWENPYPDFHPDVSWKRHLIKGTGAKQYHDQIFADFKGTGKPQLAFWNQGAKTLFLADIPADPRHAAPWPLQTVFSGQAGEHRDRAAKYAEGIDAADVDGDGRPDLLAGNYWFKYAGGKFTPVKVGTIGGRIRAGRFAHGKYAQIVIAPGDGSGPLKFYETKGDPANPASWVGRKLIGRDLVHGHTLDLGDIDGDGNLDILAAEMGRWTHKPGIDNPDATAWILYGDGKGNFRTTVLVKGEGWHEGKLADVDGDGDLDIINKPYSWDTPRIDLWLNNGTGNNTRQPKAAALHHQVGMELWSYRRELRKDLPGTLALIHQLGFTDIETSSYYGHSAADFRKILDRSGLRCSSIVVSYRTLAHDMDSVIHDARVLGAHYVVTADIPHKDRLTAEDVRKASADFNRWGAELRTHGLQFAYHPHGFEFVPYGKGNLFDLMLSQTSPKLVAYEMDVFWFARGGADPVRYLREYPQRFELVHLKDMARGTPVGTDTGRAPKGSSVALGNGQLRMAAILRAAEQAGIKRYYIEDESPAAPQQIPVSLNYLRTTGF